MIEFGPLASADTTGELSVGLRLRALLLGMPLEEGEGVMAAQVRMAASLGGEEGGAGGPAVVTPSAAAGSLNVGGQFAASVDVTAQLSCTLGTRITSYGGEIVAGDTPGYLAGALEVTPTTLAEVPPAQAFAFIVPQPPEVTILAGVAYERVTEQVVAEHEIEGVPLIGLRERAEFLWGGITALDIMLQDLESALGVSAAAAE